LRPETVDRIVQEARQELGDEHSALLEEFGAYLKDPALDRPRGASLSYRLGGTLVAVAKKADKPLADFYTPLKLMAALNLKQGDRDIWGGPVDDSVLEQIVYPSVWDRLLED
jgi:hypothetical protein